MSNWISVKDRLPEVDFLGAHISEGKIASIEVMSSPSRGYLNDDGKFSFFALWGGRLCRVTHWQPLPEPPKDGE